MGLRIMNAGIGNDGIEPVEAVDDRADAWRRLLRRELAVQWRGTLRLRAEGPAQSAVR